MRLITFDVQLGNMGAGFGEDVVQLPYLTDKETEVQMCSLMGPFSRSKTGTRRQTLSQVQLPPSHSRQTVVLLVSSVSQHQNKFTK